jgi:hypothetical protein
MRFEAWPASRAEADEPARALTPYAISPHWGRTREVVVVPARTATRQSAAVVDLLDEPKALGSISRHAVDAQTSAGAGAGCRRGEISECRAEIGAHRYGGGALERIESSESFRPWRSVRATRWPVAARRRR